MRRMIRWRSSNSNAVDALIVDAFKAFRPLVPGWGVLWLFTSEHGGFVKVLLFVAESRIEIPHVVVRGNERYK